MKLHIMQGSRTIDVISHIIDSVYNGGLILPLGSTGKHKIALRLAKHEIVRTKETMNGLRVTIHRNIRLDGFVGDFAKDGQYLFSPPRGEKDYRATDRFLECLFGCYMEPAHNREQNILSYHEDNGRDDLVSIFSTHKRKFCGWEYHIGIETKALASEADKVLYQVWNQDTRYE